MDDDLVFADSAGHTIIDIDAARDAQAAEDPGEAVDEDADAEG